MYIKFHPIQVGRVSVYDIGRYIYLFQKLYRYLVHYFQS